MEEQSAFVIRGTEVRPDAFRVSVTERASRERRAAAPIGHPAYNRLTAQPGERVLLNASEGCRAI